MEVLKFENGKQFDDCYKDKWMTFNRPQIEEVMSCLGDNFYPENWLTVRLDNDFHELVWCGKPGFHRVKILRHVLAPYVKDGKPRNWFKGTNGEPLRWTGIGNALYVKGENAEAALEALLTALVTGEADERFFIKFQEDNEEILGFAPVKGQYVPVPVP